MTGEKKERMPAVRIRGSELKDVLEELARPNERSPHKFNLPNGGVASRILMAGMLVDSWSNAEKTTRGIKVIDPWGDSISFLASQWTPQLMEQIDELEDKTLLMVMAKLSVYESGDKKVQYAKLEAIWKIDVETVKIWKEEVEEFEVARKGAHDEIGIEEEVVAEDEEFGEEFP